MGEPPFVLGVSVWAAVKDALRRVAPGRGVRLRLPATGEEVLLHLARGRRGRGRAMIEGEAAMDEAGYMKRAIETTRAGIAAGQSPFGSVIVKDGAVVAATHNTLWRDTDPTAHAEVNCIRSAAKALGTVDLSGCTLYSTCEPCPMCLAAIHWAKIDRVVFGAAIADADAAGFSELHVPAATLAEMGGSHLTVEGGLLREECAALFDEWKRAGLCGTY